MCRSHVIEAGEETFLGSVNGLVFAGFARVATGVGLAVVGVGAAGEAEAGVVEGGVVAGEGIVEAS
jgi:hypothetical protein